MPPVRRQPPRFAPGAPGKVNYSDTNYQLVGRILETVTGKALPALFADEVYAPLGLHGIYLYPDPADDRPVRIHVGQR